MNEFLTRIASILEVETVTEADELKAFPQWDSLSVLSVIAMLDASYGVNLRAADIGADQEHWGTLAPGPVQEGFVNLVFSSRVPSQCRSALEDLLFFNPRQYRVREGIINSLEKFGHPRLEEGPNGLSVRVGDQEAQTLFAFDRDRSSSEPVGVVVFVRTAPADIAIMHIAVHPDYALQGRRKDVGSGGDLG